MNIQFQFHRYTAENSVKFGAAQDTDHPELRQRLAVDIWESIIESMEPGSKITILTNGPLTNLAQIIDLQNSSSVIQVMLLAMYQRIRFNWFHQDPGNGLVRFCLMLH